MKDNLCHKKSFSANDDKERPERSSYERNKTSEERDISSVSSLFEERSVFFVAFLRKGITTEEVIGKMQAARERVLEEIPELGEVVIQLRDSEEQEYLRSQGGSGGGGFTWFTRGKSGGGL